MRQDVSKWPEVVESTESFLNFVRRQESHKARRGQVREPL